MYFCPNWDEIFYNELKTLPKNSDFFYQGPWFNRLSLILILIVVTIDNFDEKNYY